MIEDTYFSNPVLASLVSYLIAQYALVYVVLLLGLFRAFQVIVFLLLIYPLAWHVSGYST